MQDFFKENTKFQECNEVDLMVRFSFGALNVVGGQKCRKVVKMLTA